MQKPTTHGRFVVIFGRFSSFYTFSYSVVTVYDDVLAINSLTFFSIFITNPFFVFLLFVFLSWSLLTILIVCVVTIWWSTEILLSIIISLLFFFTTF